MNLSTYQLPNQRNAERRNGEKGLGKRDADVVYDQVSDLIDPKFENWCYKKIFELGKDRVLILAAQALRS